MSSIYINIEAHQGNFKLRTELELKEGVYGIYGPSGSGKTTFLHAISGLLTPKNGVISIGKNELYDSKKKINIPKIGRGIP